MDNWILEDLEKSGLTLEDMDIEQIESEEQLTKYIGSARI